MQLVKDMLELLKRINSDHGLDSRNEEIDMTILEMESAKVCTPIVGKFSSGKSALVNALIGGRERILGEDIEPKTAVPTEIVYTPAEELVKIFKSEGGPRLVSIEEYRSMELDADSVKYVRILLNHSFLREISDVMIVDMPGFESGYEVHNKAIDEYITKSLAYIFAFPADDMIVRDSMGRLLRSLHQYDAPISVVITKADKCNQDFEELLQNLKMNLARYIPNRDLPHFVTSSRDHQIEEFEDYLLQIQNQAQEILTKKYARLTLKEYLSKTREYLEQMKNNQSLTLSELEEQSDKKNREFVELQKKVGSESERFEKDIRDSIEDIIGDVEVALDSEKSSYVTMALNNQEIREDIEQTVRETVTSSIQKRFIPKVEKYIRRMNDTTKLDSIGDVKVLFHFDAGDLNKNMTGSVIKAIGLGLLISPIVGLITYFMDKSAQDKKREEAKRQISSKLEGEVFPTVLKDVSRNLEMAIMEQVKMVNTSIENEIKSQNEVLQKALEDLRVQIGNEQAEREEKEKKIHADLQSVLEIEANLRPYLPSSVLE